MENTTLPTETVNFRKPLFGKEIEIVVYTPAREEALQILEDAYSEALRLQKIFNFYDPSSEISRLNRERTLNASAELLEVINMALKLAPETGGKYDISLGKRILLRKSGREDEKIKSSYKDIKIEGNKIVLKDKLAMIDLGSIAKGYITDKIAEFLKEKGLKEFVIDSRGDIVFSGDCSHVVGIAHPRKQGERIASLKIKNKAVATSGDYNQFYGSHEKSHIINAGNLISVSVVAATLAEADAYATALFVADEKERERMLKKNKNIKVLTVDRDMKIAEYNNPEIFE